MELELVNPGEKLENFELHLGFSSEVRRIAYAEEIYKYRFMFKKKV